jgi:hypothetical protein
VNIIEAGSKTCYLDIMNTFIRLNPIKAGETLQDKAAEFIKGCRNKAGPRSNPSMVEATCFRAHPITQDLSVIYLKVDATLGMVEHVVEGQTFGINVQCVPMNVYNKRCFVLPVMSRGEKSITGKCACLECLRRVVIEAETNGLDAVKEIWQQFAGPVMITTATIGPHVQEVYQDQDYRRPWNGTNTQSLPGGTQNP